MSELIRFTTSSKDNGETWVIIGNTVRSATDEEKLEHLAWEAANPMPPRSVWQLIKAWWRAPRRQRSR